MFPLAPHYLPLLMGYLFCTKLLLGDLLHLPPPAPQGNIGCLRTGPVPLLICWKMNTGPKASQFAGLANIYLDLFLNTWPDCYQLVAGPWVERSTNIRVTILGSTPLQRKPTLKLRERRNQNFEKVQSHKAWMKLRCKSLYGPWKAESTLAPHFLATVLVVTASSRDVPAMVSWRPTLSGSTPHSRGQSFNPISPHSLFCILCPC